MTFAEAEQYIESIPMFAGKHTLADTGRLLDRLIEKPMESKIIHVAGTNGKGSVCAYLQSILLKSGASVGMFTSPHLQDIRERIQFQGKMISKEAFVSAFEAVQRAVFEEEEKESEVRTEEKTEKQEETEAAKGAERETEAGAGKESEKNSETVAEEETETGTELFRNRIHPSYFEYLFLMAMSYFHQNCPEYLILETGLGGRLDATNSIKAPAVCVITEIGFDHMKYLGDTLAAIAGEKAGIMKRQVPVIFLEKTAEVTEVFLKYAKNVEAIVYPVEKCQISEVNIHNKTIDFSFHTRYYNYDSLILNTTALYQTENAALSISCAELLMEEDKRICEESIQKGLKEAYWPGRMEEAAPKVYLDGAHNENGIEAFLNSIKKMDCKGRRLLLFAVAADKQYGNMIRRIAEADLFSEAAVTVLQSDRSASLHKLREIWGQYKIDCSFHQSAEEAYHHLMSEKKEEDTVYIAGSLYLIGQIKTLMRRIADD